MANPELEADIQAHAETISRVLQDWLNVEARTSMRDVNAYLMSLQNFHADIERSYNDSLNRTGGKSQGHLDRPTGVWWERFVTDPANDEVSATQTFASQMLLSGFRRNQIMLEAKSQDEYEDRWQSGELGIDLVDTVAERLTERFAKSSDEVANVDFEAADLTLDALFTTAFFTVKRGRWTQEYLYEFGHKDLYKPDAPCSILQRQMQEAWAGLATDHIIYAASLRDGDLARVPFLQPISITQQPEDPVYYPFASETPKV